MKIEQRDLEYFAVIARHGNLGRAAEALALTQPALSMSLRRLERATGARVVRRASKGIELTDAGAALLKHVNRLRVAREDILREVAEIGTGRVGHLRIGSSLSGSAAWFAEAISRLFNEAPRATVAFGFAMRGEPLRALRAGELDFLLAPIGSADGDDLTVERLQAIEVVVCCSRRHRLVHSRRVLRADLLNERWVVRPGPIALARWRGAFEARPAATERGAHGDRPGTCATHHCGN